MCECVFFFNTYLQYYIVRISDSEISDTFILNNTNISKNEDDVIGSTIMKNKELNDNGNGTFKKYFIKCFI